MTDTQKHALVMLYLGYITTNTGYTTSQLYTIYQSHQSTIDAIFANPTQLNMILQAYLPLLSQVIILDPYTIWY